MIGYFDTSAVVKLYVRENGSEAFVDLSKRCEVLIAHQIAYVEVRAALAARWRGRSLKQGAFGRLKAAFENDWNERWDKVTVDDGLLLRAGALAEQCGLSAYDSVHLGAAEAVFRVAPHEFVFAVFDARLREAASGLGIPVFPGDADYQALSRQS